MSACSTPRVHTRTSALFILSLIALAAGASPAEAQWSESDKLTGSNISGLDEFGFSVGISGTAVIVGSRNDDDKGTDAGAAFIFRKVGSSWNEEDKLLASDGLAGDRFGQAVAISGNIAVIGAYLDNTSSLTDSGSAYVFRLNGSQWFQEAKLTASDAASADYFGWAVAIDGNVIVVGAYGDDDGGTSAGSAYIYNYNGSSWIQEAKLKANDDDASDFFGVAVGISAGRAIIGAYLDEQAGDSAGSAYVFKDNGSTWSQEAKLVPPGLAPDDRFGTSVAISGNVAVVGAPHDDDVGTNSGAAYVFERNSSSWPQTAKLLATDVAAYDKFGTSVAVSGDLIAVGSFWNDEGPLTDAGAAYLFRDTGPWTQEAKIVASDPYFWEYFGNAVAVSSNTAVVGAYNDNSEGMDAGAGYVFVSGGTAGSCSSNSQCSDGNSCTMDICQNGNCVHSPLNCNDNNACTNDSCSNGNCVHTQITCNDNNACTTNSCNASTGCVYTAITCNDNNACTSNSCNASTGCVYTPINCSDNNACTTDSCSNGVCSHASITCNDNNACTSNSCNSSTGCVYTPITCNDNNACTSNGCNASSGCVYTPITCNDNNACTSNSCNNSSGCVFTPLNCSDGDPCTVDSCSGGWCYHDEGPDCGASCSSNSQCNDGNACTTDSCQNGNCVHTTITCNDNNACTTNSCNPSTGCVYTTITCNDNNACTSNSCNTSTGCVYTPINCNDGNPCTADSCSNGTCNHTLLNCNDNNVCTTDFCSNGTCGHTQITCNDNNACTTNSCNASTGCVYTPMTCNDNNPCTSNSCNSSSGCVFMPINCSDGNSCTTDSCSNGVCNHAPMNCNDGNACTADSCSNGSCNHTTVNCNDGNGCTSDWCSGGTCLHSPVLCNDGDACTTDFCSNGSCQYIEPVAAEFDCNDGDDEDCDGGADCDDPQGDCDQDPACCLPNGSSCTINAQCCSNKCLGSLGSKHCQP